MEKSPSLSTTPPTPFYERLQEEGHRLFDESLHSIADSKVSNDSEATTSLARDFNRGRAR